MSDTIQENEATSELRRLSNPSEQVKLQSDSELLALYVDGGNREALERLIERHASMVASVCRLTVADAASAEDAFQATFLILLKSARKIRRKSSVAAWLHGVAYRTASRIRKKSNRGPAFIESCDEVTKHSQPVDDPIAQLARKMELEALDRELENLPERLRVPLVEHYLLGHSAPQIAERMELSTVAVEGRLKRGRRQLRTLLAKRGISLSVLVAGSALFQQHLRGAEAAAWTQSFLNTHLPPKDSLGGETTHPVSPSPEILSLVSGELNMLSLGSFKAGLAVAALIVVGGLAVVASDQTGVATNGTSPNGVNPGGNRTAPTLTLPAAAFQDSVVAQFGGGSLQVGRTPVSESTDEQATSAAGKGSLSAAPSATPQRNPEDIQWQKPETADESTPIWLSGGKASMDAMEQNRAALAKQVEFAFDDLPIAELADWLTEQSGTQFEVNTVELDLLGIDPNMPISIRGTSSIRELLRRALGPLELTYLITESTVEITSKDASDATPNIRFYDLSYILPNPANAEAVMNGIERTIDQDSWVSAGGTSTIVLVGSMMIVGAPETTHQKIEVFLLNISKMNPKNVEKATPVSSSTGVVFGSMGGGSGGVGGMGGGMF